MNLRKASPKDAAGILKIYAPYIKNTTVTFEYEVPSISKFEMRIEHILTDYPYFVCENGGDIAGYAYGCRFSERAAYNWDMELSVYIKDEYKGRGIASALYGAVIEAGELMGIRNFYARITCPNIPSENLHRRFGFVLEGILKKSGFKHGIWKDVMYFGKHTEGDEPPKAVIPFSKLSCEAVREILEKHKTGV